MSDKQQANWPRLACGRYRHYKGGDYQVYGVGKHSESEDYMVVYRPLYGAGELWLRPLSMFVEEVEVDGQRRPRFALIEENTEDL